MYVFVWYLGNAQFKKLTGKRVCFSFLLLFSVFVLFLLLKTEAGEMAPQLRLFAVQSQGAELRSLYPHNKSGISYAYL